MLAALKQRIQLLVLGKRVDSSAVLARDCNSRTYMVHPLSRTQVADEGFSKTIRSWCCNTANC